MKINIREFERKDTKEAVRIWNRVVEDGVAFPQLEGLTEENGAEFFEGQSFTGIAYDEETGRVVGLYILHPNNVGRVGHISNASYAVDAEVRGQHIGELLVRHCLEKGKELGFRILQFNAVVASNEYAIRLYEKLGFVKIGTVPGGFLLKDGSYEDIILYYHVL